MIPKNAVKGLHAGSAVAGIGAVLTATDLTVCGGAGTLIATALAGNEVFKDSAPEVQEATRRLGEALDAEFAKSDLAPGRQGIVLKMLKHYWPTALEIAEGNRAAGKVLEKMVTRIEAAPYDDEVNERAIADFQQIVEPALDAALPPQTEREAFEQVLLERSDALLAHSKSQGGYQRMLDEGITEKAIIRLARRIASETEDLGQAWTELENAIEIAVRVQQEGRVGSNHGDFVDEVLRRVAELSREGEYKDALSEIEDALAKQEAEQVRLLASGVEIALLDGDAAKAAELLVRKADLEAGGRAAFEDLRALQDVYYVRGRDKGINLDLEVAIDLAEVVFSRANSEEESGAAGNDLGIALATLGERESGTDRLEAAVTAFEAALQEWTRERVPLDWAMTQMNLGNTLRLLGERESGTERLEAAVTAYENALLERTRERVPLKWAMTQMNLGNALQRLGERESGTERLEAAVTAYESALLERTRERVPLDWAATQMNLGNALVILGERESGTARLEAAVAAFENALMEWTRERVPLDWALTQHNLAGVNIAFHDKTEDPARLDAALGHAARLRRSLSRPAPTITRASLRLGLRQSKSVGRGWRGEPRPAGLFVRWRPERALALLT